MPQGQVLEFNRVTKRFGDVTAVADLSVLQEPAVVVLRGSVVAQRGS